MATCNHGYQGIFILHSGCHGSVVAMTTKYFFVVVVVVFFAPFQYCVVGSVASLHPGPVARGCS